MVKRRAFLKSAGASGIVGISGLAGCLGGGGGGGGGSSKAAMKFGGDGAVNFGISPSVPQEDLNVQYSPVEKHLQSYLTENYDVPKGLKVKSNIGSNYSAVIQSLGQGTTDLAETGPFAAALGVKTGNAEIILQRHGYGSWKYDSIIAVPDGSDISGLSDLSGKKVAFSDRLSTSGCLYPLFSMKKQGGLNIGQLPEGNGSQAEFDATFAGGHVQSYTLLKKGRVDAAAMGAFVRDTKTGPTPSAWKSNATELHRDKGLPRAPIVVSPKLGKKAKKAIQKAFLEAPEKIYLGKDGKADTDDDLWFDKVRKADKSTYKSVIEVANELGVGTDLFK